MNRLQAIPSAAAVNAPGRFGRCLDGLQAARFASEAANGLLMAFEKEVKPSL